MFVAHDWLQQLIIIGQVTVAMFLGGLLGVDRQLAGKAAGVRTLAIVAGASALFIAACAAAVDYRGPDTAQAGGWVLRVVAGLVTGVGFVGAGAIFKDQGRDWVGGITTAATIWLAAALGVAIALGQLVGALAVTVITLLLLRGLKALERSMGMK